MFLRNIFFFVFGLQDVDVLSKRRWITPDEKGTSEREFDFCEKQFQVEEYNVKIACNFNGRLDTIVSFV
jgi:hypothetical protein